MRKPGELGTYAAWPPTFQQPDTLILGALILGLEMRTCAKPSATRHPDPGSGHGNMRKPGELGTYAAWPSDFQETDTLIL